MQDLRGGWGGGARENFFLKKKSFFINKVVTRDLARGGPGLFNIEKKSKRCVNIMYKSPIYKVINMRSQKKRGGAATILNIIQHQSKTEQEKRMGHPPKLDIKQ